MASLALLSAMQSEVRRNRLIFRFLVFSLCATMTSRLPLALLSPEEEADACAMLESLCSEDRVLGQLQSGIHQSYWSGGLHCFVFVLCDN